MDDKIESAIREAVREADQSDELARKFLAWFAAVAAGNADVHDRDSADRHLELLYGAVKVDETFDQQESD